MVFIDRTSGLQIKAMFVPENENLSFARLIFLNNKNKLNFSFYYFISVFSLTNPNYVKCFIEKYLYTFLKLAYLYIYYNLLLNLILWIFELDQF